MRKNRRRGDSRACPGRGAAPRRRGNCGPGADFVRAFNDAGLFQISQGVTGDGFELPYPAFGLVRIVPR